MRGRVVRGTGEAGAFTQLEWVRRQTLAIAGIDPYPGTLNLEPENGAEARAWRAALEGEGPWIDPPDAAFCRARCVPVRASGVPAALLRPEVDGYPDAKVELVAALALRGALGLRDGDLVDVEPCRPLAVKAVLFDLDGTLVDTVGAYLEIAARAAAAYGLTVTEAQVRGALASGTSFWEDVVPAGAADRDALKRRLTEAAHAVWPETLAARGRVFDGVGAQLEVLRRRGYALGIVSGARAEVMDLLRAGGIERHFDAVVLGGDVARRKPDPEGLLACLARLGVAPGEAVYVGDTPIDIRASRAAGTYAVGVLTGAADGATLSQHAPDRLIESLARLDAALAPVVGQGDSV